MDTVFKVCDALENISINAATIAPSFLVCQTDTTCGEKERAFRPPTCGEITSKFASPDMAYDSDYLRDDNSVCEYHDDESDEKFRRRGTRRNHRSEEVPELLSEDESFRRPSSWASIDGRPPRSVMSSSNNSKYSKSLQELPMAMEYSQHTYTDDDNTNVTYGTYDETFSEVSTRCQTLNDAFDEGEATNNEPGHGWDMGMFGLPSLDWTKVIKKKSSWDSHGTPLTSSTTSGSSGNTNSNKRHSKNCRDDQNSLGQKDSMHDSLGEHHTEKMAAKKSSIHTIDSQEWDAGLNTPAHSDVGMTRELPSFGKSREFRSFDANRSLGDNESSLCSFKPSYMTEEESKLLHGQEGFNYILRKDSSGTNGGEVPDPSMTPSKQAGGGSKVTVISALSPETDGGNVATTTIPYSSLSKSSPTTIPPASKVFRKKRSPFPAFFKKTHEQHTQESMAV